MIIAVIPCYNEALFIGEVVSKTKYYASPIVADDHSTDGTAYEAERYGALVVTNPGKNGAGANTHSGLQKALTLDGDIIVTLDGDGQHNAYEIPQLVKPIEKGEADVVIGSRFLKVGRMARYRWVGIWVITLLYNLFSAHRITDAQCGFRAFKREVIENVPITESGFAFSTETLIKMRAKGYRIIEVPVSCIYHKEYSANSTLNPLMHGLGVALATIKWRFKVEVLNAVKYRLFGLFKWSIKPFVGRGWGKFKPLYSAYKQIARNLIPEQKKVVNINGYKMAVRIDAGRDIDGISQQLIFSGDYEPLATSLVKQLVKPHMVTLDIGANIGYYTLLLAGLGKQVWAFEPEERNYADLKNNIKLNKLANAYPVKRAVTDRSGVAEFYVSENESGEHSLIKCRNNNHKTVLVDTVALGDMFKEVDFMKVDTEGNEVQVLRGFYDSLLANNTAILLEFWVDGIRAAGYTPQSLWGLIEALGYRHNYLIDEFKKEVVATDLGGIMDYWWEHGFSSNILCLKEELNA